MKNCVIPKQQNKSFIDTIFKAISRVEEGRTEFPNKIFMNFENQSCSELTEIRKYLS